MFTSTESWYPMTDMTISDLALPPAEVILHLVAQDRASGPLEWVNNRIEHSFPVQSGDLVTGFTIINYGDPSRTPIYKSESFYAVGPKDKTYSTSLSIDILPS